MTADDQPPLVQMHHAWRWECPLCKHQNFEQGDEVEMTREEMEMQADVMRFTGEARAAFLEDWIGIGCHIMPVMVTCQNCGTTCKPDQGEGDE